MQPRAPRLTRAGGFAALYVAAAYLAAIPYFVFLVAYPSATDPEDKVTLLVTTTRACSGDKPGGSCRGADACRTAPGQRHGLRPRHGRRGGPTGQ